MSFSTKLQEEIADALTLLAPGIPYFDAEIVRSEAGARHFRAFPAKISTWLALVAHIRHQHTDYDTLLEEGYGKEAARHFVLDAINETLTSWRATRFLDEKEEA
ncbi:MAG: DUF2293 domain-containing protein [Rhizobiaceae bacterium]